MISYKEDDPFPFKRQCHFRVKVEKLGEFARESNGQRLSEPVHVVGVSWKILVTAKQQPVQEQPKSLGFYLQCKGDEESDWLYTASGITFKLLAQKPGKQDHVRELLGQREFNANANEAGFEQFMAFEELMNPENGWYNEADDSIVLSVFFKAAAPHGLNLTPQPDVLLVNNQMVNVNKCLLASRSSYFKELFFGGNFNNDNLVLDPPASVAHFKRMRDRMSPKDRPLDDQCIEGVYHLANQFFLGEVEIKCRTFLANDSNHSAVFKYRLADKYGFPMLKEEILRSNVREMFSNEADLAENREEYAKLDEQAREALDARLIPLFGRNIFAKEPAEAEHNSKLARATD